MTSPTFRILLIEDNEADVYLLRKALSDAGLSYELIVIADGAEAIDYVCGDNPAPDIAILDSNLPKHPGLDVVGAMRSTPRLKALPIVALSSCWMPRDLAEMERFGVARCITKPASLEEFLQIGGAVSDLLMNSQAHGGHR